MRRLTYTLILLTLILIPGNAFACDRDFFEEQRITASLMRLDFNYNDANRNFDVRIMNFHRDFYFTKDGEPVFPPVNPVTSIGEVNLGQFSEGAIVDIEIFPMNNPGCGRSLSRVFQRLPFANPFYTNELCADLEDCEFCERLTRQRLNESVFRAGVTMCLQDQVEVEEAVIEDVYSDYTFRYIAFAVMGLILAIGSSIGLWLIRKKLRAKKESAL